MPTIQYLSDVHVEVGNSLPPQVADLAIVAGDLCGGHQLAELFATLSARYERVLYVPGNHEYFHSSASTIHRTLLELSGRYANVVYLYPGAEAEFAGRRAVGCTLWYGPEPDFFRRMAVRTGLADCYYIKDAGYEKFVELGVQHRAWLNEAIREGDIVVTHHLPSSRSTPPRFKDSPINSAFVNPSEDIMLRRKPAVWVHGHTHDPCDYTVGITRVLCNPLGYPREHRGNYRTATFELN